VTDTGVEAPHALLRVLGECLVPARRVVLETSGVRGGQDDPRVAHVRGGDWRRTTTPVHWAFAGQALVPWAGPAAFAVGLVDAREIAGDPRIIDTLEGDQAARGRRSASSAAS
jgi:hypothetical protein